MSISDKIEFSAMKLINLLQNSLFGLNNQTEINPKFVGNNSEVTQKIEEEEYKILSFSISIIFVKTFFITYMGWYPLMHLPISSFIFLFLFGCLKKRRFSLIKWILTFLPILLPYELASYSQLVFAIQHMILFPIICIILTRSLVRAITMLIINIIGSFAILQPKLFELFELKSCVQDPRIVMIKIAYAWAFIIVLLIIIMIWFLFEARRKTLIGMFEQKKKIDELNESLTESNIKLMENLKSKEELILHVSHELRNPLNIISGSYEMAALRMDILNITKDQAIEQDLERIKSSVDIIIFFLNNLLDSAKLEKHELELSYHKKKMWEFMEKVWNTSKILIERKKLNAKMYVDKNLPEELRIDSIRILQVIYNLVGNAVKFTTEGYIGIICTWIPQSRLNGLNIEDTTQLADILNFGEEHEIVCRQLIREGSPITNLILSRQTPMYIGPNFGGSHNSIDESKDDQDHEKRMSRLLRYNLEREIRTLKYKQLCSAYYNIDYMTTSKDSSSNKETLQYLNKPTPIQGKRQAFSIEDNMGSCSGIKKGDASTLKIIKPNKEETTGYLIFEVMDSGCGMKTEQLDKLFKKFSQIGTSSQKQIGTGLGLYISKYLCNKMKGDLAAKSSVNQGTTFTAYIWCEQQFKDIKKENECI